MDMSQHARAERAYRLRRHRRRVRADHEQRIEATTHEVTTDPIYWCRRIIDDYQPVIDEALALGDRGLALRTEGYMMDLLRRTLAPHEYPTDDATIDALRAKLTRR